jgi:hypothetical protein
LIWKDVVGYEGIYEVSNTGLIRTHKNKTTISKKNNDFVRHWKQRVLKQKVGKDKCCRVELYKNKKSKTWLVHRLVAFAFIPKIKGKEYINHIDGDRLNNCVENLEWCNHLENNNHAFDNHLIKTGCEVILYDNETKEIHEFRSMEKADQYLGKYHGFVSRTLKMGINHYANFTIKKKRLG